MAEFLNKHSVKMQLGVLAGFVIAVISASLYFGGFMGQVDANSNVLNSHKIEIKKIPVIENSIENIEDDIKEIKGDIKLLLNK